MSMPVDRFDPDIQKTLTDEQRKLETDLNSQKQTAEILFGKKF